MKPSSIFILKKQITSPQFVRTLEVGRLFKKDNIDSMFPFISKERLNEWFEDVSDKYYIRNCHILPIENVS